MYRRNLYKKHIPMHGAITFVLEPDILFEPILVHCDKLPKYNSFKRSIIFGQIKINDGYIHKLGTGHKMLYVTRFFLPYYIT